MRKLYGYAYHPAEGMWFNVEIEGERIIRSQPTLPPNVKRVDASEESAKLTHSSPWLHIVKARAAVPVVVLYTSFRIDSHCAR